MLQKQALDILKTGVSVFLTGEPGSGKSHTIREYINYLKKAGIEVAVTASTGIAATHIGGITLHSWSGIGIKEYLSDFELDRIASNERIVKRIVNTKVLIIDEISMLGGNVLESVDRVCREIRHKPEPFGGLQVILVGDFFQLPPIFKGETPVQFSFNSQAWSNLKLVTCYLTEQFRQEDKVFLKILSAIRRNEIDAEHCSHLDGRCVSVPAEQDQAITKLFSHNINVDRLNENELKKIDNPLKKFVMQTSGRPFLIEQLKRSCLSPEALMLKKGAVVMFTKNSPKGAFVNGTLGKIVDFNSFSNQPVVETLAGRIIEAEPMEWAIEENGRVLARIIQFPLRLAWAITVHKSQGMSLDAAYIDLRDAFVEGQGYVALSRVRSLEGLYLAGYNERALKVHPEVIEIDDFFRSQSEDIASAFGKLSVTEINKMHENFVCFSGGKWPLENGEEKPKKYSVTAIRKERQNAYRPWTQEEEDLLTESYLAGKSLVEISEQLKRKPGAIRARVKKIGLDEMSI